MPRVVYLLSSAFHYNQIIAGDAGPSFGADYGWESIVIGRLAETPCDIVVVDTRFDASELSHLRTAMEAVPATFVFRLCDPIWEHTRNHWWYKFVGEMLDRPRVHVMLNYHPAEITAMLFGRSRRSQFLFAPYVYRQEMEYPLDHAGRKHRLLLSGARHRALYPMRARMARAAFWWMPLRAFCATLEHPGYPDIGQRQRHNIIGQKYLDLLATFRFAAVCSSRCRIELLKYREFAYAGVVPVGDMPATLLDCPADAWVPWRRNIVRLTRTLRSMDDTDERAQKYRQFMRDRRNVAAMRELVREQLKRLA